ncbi:MAG: methylmalonyl Co-A mutase-associated GTPase MeaB [Thermoleophilia bacterium]
MEGVLSGDNRSIARTISLIEDGLPSAREVVRRLYPRAGRAFMIGITGPPGVGKSSLISALVGLCRRHGAAVGVISVDPSSPFSQGAVLGDRVRLSEHFLDPEVFIRSMSTRGHLGGLSETSMQAAFVLDASGKDVVFLETVGVGQSEVEVASVADTTVLVLMPGSGDSIQALKAGIMEIPDVIVVNKKDHPAAMATLNEVRAVLALAEKSESDWSPPLVATDAVAEDGVTELWEAVESHRNWMMESGLLEVRRRKNLESEIVGVAAHRMERFLLRKIQEDPEVKAVLGLVQRGELDPLSAVETILGHVLGAESGLSLPGGLPIDSA